MLEPNETSSWPKRVLPVYSIDNYDKFNLIVYNRTIDKTIHMLIENDTYFLQDFKLKDQVQFDILISPSKFEDVLFFRRITNSEK